MARKRKSKKDKQIAAVQTRLKEKAFRARRGPELSTGKKVLFAVVATAGFFVCLEALLGVIGVQPVLYSEDPYVGFAGNIPLFVEEAGSGGQTYLTTSPNKIRWFNEQSFPKEKGSGVYRIFTVGGSTTYGRPYDDRGSFSAWLREFLSAADSSRKWEVINAGGISYASYRVALLMEELIQYEPDLFIVYSGHNEFLERRTYPDIIEAPRSITALGGLMSRTRTYAAGQRLLSGANEPRSEARDSETVLKGEVDTLLAHSVGPSEYRRDDAWQRQVMDHYRFNLNRMIDIARSGGAEVVLVTPAANWKDSSPFKSEHRDGLTQADRGRFEQLFERGRTARRSGDLTVALEAFEQALQIDDRYADLQYEWGLALYEAGRYEDAKKAFRRALDEDVCPLRILSPMRRIVSEVAAERDVALVDFAGIIEERSPHGIPGAEHFLDHVHLTLDGYRLLGLELLDELAEQQVVQIGDGWNDAAIAAAARRVEQQIDEQAHGVALRNLAKVLDWAGKQQDAARLAERAIEVLGEDAESYNVLGRAASSRGDLDEAIRYFRKALELKPDYVEPHTPLGIALGKQGKVEEAIFHFRQALEGKPDFPEAHFNLGFALGSQGKWEEAIEHYRQALRFRPDYAAAYNNLGIALRQTGRLDDAIKSFRQALEANPEHTEARLNLGLAMQAKGDTDAAAGQFQQAAEEDEMSAGAYNNLGNTLLSAGSFEDAERNYRRAIEAEPDNPEPHYNLGNLRMGQGRPEEAARHYREAIRLKPEYAEAHTNLGNALMAAGRLEEAIESYRRAMRIAPDRAEPHHNLGLALMSRGKAGEAIRHYQTALRLNPDYAEAHINLGSALMAEDRLDEAVRHYREAIRIRPDSADAHFNLGLALGAQQELDSAIGMFRRAIELSPEHAKAHYYLGNSLAVKGRFEEALGHFREAARLAPDWPTPLDHMAWLLATHPDPKLRNGPRAVELAERAAKLTKFEDSSVIDTLAAAYAEAGDFDSAAAAAQKASELYAAAGQNQLAERTRGRLELYRQSKPYREPSRNSASHP